MFYYQLYNITQAPPSTFSPKTHKHSYQVFEICRNPYIN